MKSLYIHIPFCKQICPYCDFAKTNIHNEQLYRDYTNALCTELNSLTSESLYTIYFGGGTPSCLPVNYLEQIFNTLHNNFDLSQVEEITFEVNPNTINQEYLNRCRELGINRLSIGVQSFDEILLKKLARGHNIQDVYNVLDMSWQAGFDNISIDLIYGLPGQSLDTWQETLNRACELDVQHISSYSLIIEENTPYGRLYSKNKLNIPTDDINAQMYGLMCETLKDNGFDHYEISNFSRDNKYSRHNYAYWNMQEYYAVGLGASGFINNIRYKNTSDLQQYIQNREKSREIEELYSEDLKTEELMLALRTKQGIDLAQYQAKYSVNIQELYQEKLLQYTKRKLIEIDNNIMRLTEQGFYLSNEIVVNLLE